MMLMMMMMMMVGGGGVGVGDVRKSFGGGSGSGGEHCVDNKSYQSHFYFSSILHPFIYRTEEVQWTLPILLEVFKITHVHQTNQQANKEKTNK